MKTRNKPMKKKYAISYLKIEERNPSQSGSSMDTILLLISVELPTKFQQTEKTLAQILFKPLRCISIPPH